MIAKIGRTLPWLLGVLGFLSISSSALAQGNVFNPYGNSGYADYREFSYPMYSNNPALPGQSILNAEPLITRPRANSYQQYVNELQGTDSGSGLSARSTTSNLPYYQAYRTLNPQFNRVYRPGNTDSDRKFNERLRQGDTAFAERLNKRDAAYAAAMAERDPLKRAKLLRQVEQDFRPGPNASASRANAGSRASNPGVNGSATSSATRAPAPPGFGITTAPAERRQPAPSLSPGTNTRRPSATGPVARPSTPSRSEATDSETTRPRGVTRPAPDPSTIPIPPPR